MQYFFCILLFRLYHMTWMSAALYRLHNVTYVPPGIRMIKADVMGASQADRKGGLQIRVFPIPEGLLPYFIADFTLV